MATLHSPRGIFVWSESGEGRPGTMESLSIGRWLRSGLVALQSGCIQRKRKELPR